MDLYSLANRFIETNLSKEYQGLAKDLLKITVDSVGENIIVRLNEETNKDEKSHRKEIWKGEANGEEIYEEDKKGEKLRDLDPKIFKYLIRVLKNGDRWEKVARKARYNIKDYQHLGKIACDTFLSDWANDGVELRRVKEVLAELRYDVPLYLLNEEIEKAETRKAAREKEAREAEEAKVRRVIRELDNKEIEEAERKIKEIEGKEAEIGVKKAEEKEISAKKEDKDDTKNCVICMDLPRTNAISPCGHLCCCEKCIRGLKFCPICRREVRGNMKIFIP